MTKVSSRKEKAIRLWQESLGLSNVVVEPERTWKMCRDMSTTKREILAVLRPQSTAEVKRVVEIANETKTPVYPTSTGQNWGLGARMPVIAGAAVVDLSRMNRIREINTRHGYVVLESGVTQRQLHEFLVEKNVPFLFNVTGAPSWTSILGNILDRGTGYFRPRYEEISGMEVVLGNGEVLCTGFGEYANSEVTHLYSPGVGPSLDGIFSQSNFGIVTAAGFSLIPQKESMICMNGSVKSDTALPEFIDILGDLRGQGVIDSVVHVANRSRIEMNTGPVVFDFCKRELHMDSETARYIVEQILEKDVSRSWTFLGSIHGTRLQTKAAMRTIKKITSRVATIRFFRKDSIAKIQRVLSYLSWMSAFRRKKILIDAMGSGLDLPFGKPIDISMKSMYWPLGPAPEEKWEDPSRHSIGALWVLPILPLDGGAVQRMLKRFDSVFSDFNFVPYITLNSLNSKALECVLNISFDKSSNEQCASAHQCVRRLHNECMEMGYIPYRLHVDDTLIVADEKNPFWRTIGQLKRALDPNEIIAPGRYALHSYTCTESSANH